MNGITSGGRLEQLYRLQARVNLEIAAERRRLVLDNPTPPDARPDIDLAAELGVTHAELRLWAITVGLTPPKRGKVPNAMIRLYIAEHARTAATEPTEP